MKLLHIDSSVLGPQSASRELSAAVVARWRERVPGITVSHRDLDADPLPHLDQRVLSGLDPVAAARNAALLDEFLAADVVVIGAPMYNFTIASSLKAWIDRILVAGRTFRYTADGPEGLAGDKTVVIVSSRGSALGDASPADFQEGYLRQVFGFIGIRDLRLVRAEGLALSPDHRQQALAAAHERIDEPALAVAA